MTFPSDFFDQLLDSGHDMIQMSEDLLQKAPLTARQRSDVNAIASAARQFYKLTEENRPLIETRSDAQDLKFLRHDLLNHLNIVVGFSKVLVRELPDNLLLHMIDLRQLHDIGNTLSDRIRDLR